MRLFAAIELPDDDRRFLGDLDVFLPRARWVDDEALHVTLRFLGDVVGPSVERVIDGFGAVAGATAPFEIALRGVGQFPPNGPPRVLWVGVDADAGLARLHKRVDQVCRRAGLEPETRRYAPHVTLARMRPDPGNTAAVREFIETHATLSRPSFVVDRFVLFSSVRGRQGAVYRPEAAFPLRGEARD